MPISQIDIGRVLGVYLHANATEQGVKYKVIILSSKFGRLEIDVYDNLADAEKRFKEFLGHVEEVE